MGTKTSQKHRAPRASAAVEIGFGASAKAAVLENGDWLSIDEALRIIRAQLQRLSAQHVAVLENERQRLAMELHDGLGQTLSLAKFTLQEGSIALSNGATDKVAKCLEQAISQVKSGLEDMRRIATNLRPSALDDLGIVATINWYMREFELAQPGIALKKNIRVKEADVPDALKIAIFRIIQEATNNTLKYAQARRLEISLTIDDGNLKLSIEDDGLGFEMAQAEQGRNFDRGIGLRSMKDRAEISGGESEISSSPGRGTQVRAWWQLMDGSEANCPVIPVKRKIAQSMCQSIPTNELRGQLSACMQCLRSIEAA